MRYLLVILIFLINNSFAFGQDEKKSFWEPYVVSDIKRLDLKQFDSLNYQKAYRIWNPHQVVELIEINDTTYIGQLVNFATKITREEKSIGTISQKLKIPDFTVKLLIEKLSSENIETLSDSYDVKGYVNGLDGTTLIFEIFSNKKIRIYSYWEPENDYYQNPNLSEVKSIRNILTAIKAQIDLERLFSDFTNNLERGSYNLGGVIMEKK